MENTTLSLIKTYADIGLPTLIAVAVVALAIKYAPTVIDQCIEKRKKFDTLTEALLVIAQQGNAVIERNNILFEKTTDTIDNNTRVIDRISTSFSKDMCHLDDRIRDVADTVDKTHLTTTVIAERLNTHG